MPSQLRTFALALLLCTGCDAGSPRVGSPGLEPPHGPDDAGVPGAGQGGGMDTTGGAAGATGSPTTGTGGGVGQAAGGAGGSGVPGGTGAITDPGGDAGAADAGPDGGALSFSELHAAELMKDCQETVNCLLQRDEPLEADPLAACLEDSARALAGDESRQASFLANVARCRAFVVCDYYDCATTPP